ncbi:MAG: hypothetical protein GY731_19765 [Gammaproteobacteria bacterium]|nr:hypothetical protein [Gammaproteobacteria bacterium]
MTPAFRLNENTGEYEATSSLVQSDILDQAKTILSEKLMRSSEPLSNPSDTKDFLIAHMSELEHEVYGVIFLDNRHRPIIFRRKKPHEPFYQSFGRLDIYQSAVWADTITDDIRVRLGPAYFHFSVEDARLLADALVSAVESRGG